MTRAPSTRGFTLIETLIGATLMVFFLLTFGQVFASSEALAQDSRLHLRAHEDLRRNLESVADTLRGIDFETLDGFDGSGEATAPSFARVTGADEFGRTHGGVEGIVWRPHDRPVRGVEHPGYLVHVHDGTETLVADRVPAYGFRVRMEDGTLAIRLSTYYALDSAHAIVHGATSVAPRN